MIAWVHMTKMPVIGPTEVGMAANSLQSPGPANLDLVEGHAVLEGVIQRLGEIAGHTACSQVNAAKRSSVETLRLAKEG